jgi:hemolysin activation/secretion protein
VSLTNIPKRVFPLISKVPAIALMFAIADCPAALSNPVNLETTGNKPADYRPARGGGGDSASPVWLQKPASQASGNISQGGATASRKQDRITPPIPQPPLPQEPLPTLPPPEDLLPLPEAPSGEPGEIPGDIPDAIQVDRYQVEGSTVFTPEELAEVTMPFTGPAVAFTDLLQARAAVTQLYIDNGYLTSGAFIPLQTLENNIVIIQVLEGRLEEINVTGTDRLNPSYVRSRLRLAGRAPLNVPRLLEGLQLLQLDPLIENISADLQAGVQPGTNRLEVEIVEADSFAFTASIDNRRSPSVGSFRRQIAFNEGNLFGFGDRAEFEYTNTDGSNGIDLSYTLPVNPRNGTVRFAFGSTASDVIEPPFDVLGISSTSRYYELGFRQPLYQSPAEEFALGITLSRQESQTELGFEDIGPFPLSPGADDQGRTRISAIRFTQEWVERSSRHVLAGRSQFSLGVDWFDATDNEGAPDSEFFAWRGQGQWVRLLERDALVLVRGDVQLTGDNLVPLEQIGIGGQETVRGYRQDALLTDSGALLTAELRWPVLRIPEIQGLLQIAPFVDVGIGWNNDIPDPDPNGLVGLGLGLVWQQGDNFSARLDWGIPLVDVESRDRTWQEDGIYFSVIYTPF